MEIIIRSSVKEELAEKVPSLIGTANELEYLKEYHPSIYKKFMK